MSSDIAGKTAIVTGASRGIGKAIALELARRGVNLAICARTKHVDPTLPGTIGQTAEEITAVGVRVLAMRVDIGDDDDIRTMVTRTRDEFGTLDILVNNAAYIPEGGFLDSTIDELDLAYRLNVRAAYLATQLVAPAMIRTGGGVIFNITSGASRLSPVPQGTSGAAPAMNWRPHPGYGITKAALDRATNALALELYEQNVAVIAVNPGFTVTERVKMLMPDRQNSGNRPEDTALVIAKLARNPMKYTGQILNTSDVRSTL
jgi:NAD(P)-dependent dehydrogenase (short-subunit alcohol dehydrogenase family)